MIAPAFGVNLAPLASMTLDPTPITHLLEEIDLLIKQLRPKAGGQTLEALAREVEGARRELRAVAEDPAAAMGATSRLFDVAHQRVAAVLRDYELTVDDRRALEASAADLSDWRMKLLADEREQFESASPP
jgi:hypothetical protein